MGAPALRAEEELEPVREQGGAHPVLVAQRREGDERRELGRQLALEDGARSEAEAAGDVHRQEHREVALLDEDFLTNGWPMRAVTFQSMVRTSSPGW